MAEEKFVSLLHSVPTSSWGLGSFIWGDAAGASSWPLTNNEKKARNRWIHVPICTRIFTIQQLTDALLGFYFVSKGTLLMLNTNITAII